MLKGSYAMNEFKYEEFEEICKRFGETSPITDVTITYDSRRYYNRLKNMIQKDRRGEVVFCVIRPNGKIISITCDEYPEGIYRIPTGGIGHDEDIIGAVFREVREELGLDVRVRSFGGVVRIRIEHLDDFIMFYSYIFVLDEIGGRLLEDASDDEISGIRELDISELEEVVERLGCIKGKWKDWGRFRYVTSNAVLNCLKNI